MRPEQVLVLPTSFGQERLWLHEQVRHEAPLYNVAGGVRFAGELDLDVLRRCLSRIVARHEVLRTVFRLEGARVSQVVRPPHDVDVEIAEVSGDLEETLRELAAAPFDLAAGPLFRCHLLRTGPGEQLLFMVMHHIIGDGRSRDVLLMELGELYDAAVSGREAHLPDLPVQYADFAVWQRQVLESGALDDQVAYWRDRLDGAPELSLPLDHPRPERPRHGVRTAELAVPDGAMSRLRTVGGGLTPFMVALAGYAALLGRWSGQPSIVVALPAAGRDEPELENLVGFLVNTLPVRMDLDDDPTLAELLRRTRDRCLEAFSNAAVPVEKLMEELRPHRKAGRLPFAQAWLVLQDPPVLGSLFGREVEAVVPDEARSPFDIALQLRNDGEALLGTLAGAADVFDAETVRAAARTFAAILEADPATRVSELPFLIDQTSVVFDTAPGEPGPGPEDVAATTATEHLLAELWAEVLELDAVSVDDEFYALGGNSLRAVSVMMRAHELGLELPVELVLGEHTVRELAAGAGSTDKD
ncbi:condensation domain-containing protein [Nonomuraea sp. NPDC004186]